MFAPIRLMEREAGLSKQKPRKDELYCFLRKTKLCWHFPNGKCVLGSRCKFAHSVNDLKENPDLRNTRMCNSVKKGQQCWRGDACTYAHSQEELRRANKYREVFQTDTGHTSYKYKPVPSGSTKTNTKKIPEEGPEWSSPDLPNHPTSNNLRSPYSHSFSTAATADTDTPTSLHQIMASETHSERQSEDLSVIFSQTAVSDPPTSPCSSPHTHPHPDRHEGETKDDHVSDVTVPPRPAIEADMKETHLNAEVDIHHQNTALQKKAETEKEIPCDLPPKRNLPPGWELLVGPPLIMPACWSVLSSPEETDEILLSLFASERREKRREECQGTERGRAEVSCEGRGREEFQACFHHW
uniref:C3H1-type domain-containing protein n=1 Tax=Chromera velia CCMP2878 TaxID=1169474 RepID=A0A0G4I9L3_9ALVE|eukprot:Cvel_12190.t1-p1 / transcript=Cvel_12190.t1 / gene=Cvel_12190 / organism=Chromera_velia_CCMP2878 / gene_product=Putative E3 ubiquitin-protein ligase UNKL, putative / transcript_product=Putative E3 ubiquitin-protein ligase UNKL, putative / location=Cvel_scaffold788:7522-9684(-) / protein_length=354 / sequence_SO=supercontig / SO=protein_coding / is_pseudo=false